MLQQLYYFACFLAVVASFKVNYEDFQPVDLATIQLNFDAEITGGSIFYNFNSWNNSKAIQLTQATFGQGGTAFLKNSVPLTNGTFSTHFSFYIDDGGGSVNDTDTVPGADGICFVITTAGNDQGNVGGGIGYLVIFLKANGTIYAAIPTSVAVEFDTFQNFYPVSDPNGNHVGFDINGNMTSLVTTDVTPYAT